MSLLQLSPAEGRRVSQEFEELLKVLSYSSTHLGSNNPGVAHISVGPSLNLGGGKEKKIKQFKLGSISNTADGQGPLLAIGSSNNNRALAPDW